MCITHRPHNTGVLTKLDIMDPGTDAREIITGSQVQLKNGWIAVVNRNQQDINSRVGMQDARKKVRCIPAALQPCLCTTNLAGNCMC